MSTNPATDLVVNVSPVADCVQSGNSTSIMLEDATLSTNVGQVIDANLIIKDNAISNPSVANNNVREYLSRVELLEPKIIDGIPILKFLYTNVSLPGITGKLENLGPSNSSFLDYDLTSTNSFIIRSVIIESARAGGTLGNLTTPQLQAAEQDIRFVLTQLSALPSTCECSDH